MTEATKWHEPEKASAPSSYAPGPIFYTVTIAGSIGMIVQDWAMDVFWLAMLLWPAAVLACLWLGLAVVAAVRTRLRMSRRVWARWLGIPAIGCLALSLVLSSVPFRLRFELSRASFQQVAARVQAGETGVGGDVGLFHIQYVDQLPNGIWFEDLSLGFFDVCGLAYTISAEPRIDYVEMDLGGGWWLACKRF